MNHIYSDDGCIVFRGDGEVRIPFNWFTPEMIDAIVREGNVLITGHPYAFALRVDEPGGFMGVFTAKDGDLVSVHGRAAPRVFAELRKVATLLRDTRYNLRGY